MIPRVVVLGASGFIGRRVVQAIAAEGAAAPLAVSRNATRTFAGAGVEACDMDVAGTADLRPVLAGAGGIVNCIAGSPASLESSTQALLEAISGLSPQPRLVHLSSMAAYGAVAGRVDESMPLRGDLDAYSAAKARTDGWVSGCETAVILRPGIVFGPGSVWWSDRIARLLVLGRLGDLGAAGTGLCNPIYVDDVATAVLRALRLEGHSPGAFNLAHPDPITWNDYFARYARALRAVPLRPVSPLRLRVETRLLAPPLKLLELLLRRPSWARWNPLPPLRPWLPELCGRTLQLDVTRATRLLGMTWTPLDQSLATTAAWFRAGGRTAL